MIGVFLITDSIRAPLSSYTVSNLSNLDSGELATVGSYGSLPEKSTE